MVLQSSGCVLEQDTKAQNCPWCVVCESVSVPVFVVEQHYVLYSYIEEKCCVFLCVCVPVHVKALSLDKCFISAVHLPHVQQVGKSTKYSLY